MAKKSKKNANNAAAKLARRAQLAEVQDHLARCPPPFSSTVRMPFSIRWFMNAQLGNNSSGTSITWRNIADWLCIGTSSTTAHQLFNQCVRLKRVRIWAPNSSSSNSGVATYVDFTGVSAGSVGPSRRIQAGSTSADVPAYVDARPPKSGSTSLWHTNIDTGTAFTLACPAGSLVQVDYDGVNQEDNLAQAVATAPASATVGATYITGITGVLPGSAPICVPQGFSALT